MSRKLSPRVKEALQKYVDILGSEDCGPGKNGNLVWLGDNKVAMQKRHLFYIKSTDIDNAAGAFVLGNTIPDIIRSDAHEVKYIGEMPLNDKAKKILDECQARIERDEAAGKKAKRERQGVYEEPDVEGKD